MLRFELTVCVLLHRDGRWLLSVRRPDVAYAPGRVGLIGGHVEIGAGAGTLEDNARREVREETGVDLSEVRLDYLVSTQFAVAGADPMVDVTFLAEVPAGAEPILGAPDELTEVGWWTTAELQSDARCPTWLVDLVASVTSVGACRPRSRA